MDKHQHPCLPEHFRIWILIIHLVLHWNTRRITRPKWPASTILQPHQSQLKLVSQVHNAVPCFTVNAIAVKRRFIRQNREIARVNSMQSLRIRSLESEVSHLLAENVSLREQVINFTQEIERLEAAKMINDRVSEIKSRLDMKVSELSNLALELGMLPRITSGVGDGKPGIESDRPITMVPSMKGRPGDSEHTTEVDHGRLSPILEDKFYPRRTLE